MNEKKLRKSGVVIALYVIAVISVLYAGFVIVSSISYVSQYYAQYGMEPGFTDYFSQVVSSAYMPVLFAVVLFACARILKEVRALNPTYYVTVEEITAAKAAKAAAKAEKSAEKTEFNAAVGDEIMEADTEVVEVEETTEAEAKATE